VLESASFGARFSVCIVVLSRLGYSLALSQLSPFKRNHFSCSAG
jgi:hypothetical protein